MAQLLTIPLNLTINNHNIPAVPLNFTINNHNIPTVPLTLNIDRNPAFAIHPRNESPCIVKYIPGHPNYACSQDGHIYSHKRTYWCRKNPEYGSNIGQRVTFCEEGCTTKYYIRDLIALAWVPNPSGLSHVYHIDYNKYNNNASNLKWSDHIMNYYADEQKQQEDFFINPLVDGILQEQVKVRYVHGTNRYCCTETGVVYVRKPAGWKPLKYVDHKGYFQCVTSHCGKAKTSRVHRIIATAWIPNPHDLPEVDHIDRNRKNNNVNNLRWVTRAANNENRLYENKIPTEHMDEYLQIKERHRIEMEEFCSRIKLIQ